MLILLILLFIRTFFSLVTLSLHIVGIYLLSKPNTYQKHQKIYLTNISVLEILFLMTSLAQAYFRYFKCDDCYMYAGIFFLAFIMVSWHNAMIVLTIDRYLEIRLNIKYELYISRRLARILVAFSWSLGGLCFVVSTVVQVFLKKINTCKMVSTFVLLPYSGILMAVLMFTYWYIYRKMKRCRQIFPQTANSVEHLRRKKHQFVPIWIVFTYITCSIIPLIVLHKILSNGTNTRDRNSLLFHIIALLHICCCFGDVFIYIYLNLSMRRRFIGLFRQKKRVLTLLLMGIFQ